jgi:hypothetical protein
MPFDRLSTLRERKAPSRFTVDNAEEVDHHIRSRTARARNAPPGTSSAHKITDVSSSLPRVDMDFTIINMTSPSCILGYKEGAVYYPPEGGLQDGFPASHISTKDGVTHVRPVHLAEYAVDYTKLPYRATEIIFDAEDVWNSTIKAAEDLGIVKPTHLAKFLKRVKRGKSAYAAYHFYFDHGH